MTCDEYPALCGDLFRRGDIRKPVRTLTFTPVADRSHTQHPWEGYYS